MKKIMKERKQQVFDIVEISSTAEFHIGMCVVYVFLSLFPSFFAI
jgi:hypothetical protein